MTFRIIEEATDVLPEYEKVPIAFRVESRFRVQLIENGLGGLKLVEEKVEPYIKDYDANENESPSKWLKRFDTSNWGVLSAFEGDTRIGGAVMAWNTPEVMMLENQTDLACLWDLRVRPEYRNKGIGQQLFERAVIWAKERNCRRVIVETQDVNVPACRFYVRQGCRLGAVNTYAYPESMDEIQLVWYLNI